MTRANMVAVRSPRGSTSDLPKVASVVIVVMLLIVSIFWYIGSQYQEEEVEPPDDGEDGDDVTIITEETLWESVDMTLDRPVEVMDGATLRIVGSDVRILLEDLMRSNVPWFTVHDGGVLELEGSHLTVYKAPQLDNAVLVGRVRGLRGESLGYPSLSRVFNLAGADEPILNLDVYWKETESPVIVAGQSSPDDDLEALEILECPTSGPDNWVHFEVSLSDFAGEELRIAVFPVEEVNQSVMISDMVVLDEGQGLPYDLPMTGNPAEDDWMMNLFEPIIEPDEPFFYWHPLMDVEGTVILEGSDISSVPGLPRVREGDQHGWGPGTPVYRKMSNHPDGYNVGHVTRGGQIELRHATLTINDTNMDYVPIVGMSSQVNIIESDIRGDHDLVTLSDTVGSIIHTDFFTDPLSDQIPLERSDAQFIWALSLENSTTSFTIGGCAFTGLDLGLDLTNVRVRVTDCEFINTKRLAIWDHNSVGLDGWQKVSSANYFSGGEGHHYLRTHVTVLEHIGPGVDDPGFDKSGSSGSSPRYWGEPNLPEFDSFDFGSTRSVFCMPTEVTTANGTWTAIPNVTVRIGNNWGGEVTVTIDTNETLTQAIFPGISPLETHYLSVESITRVPWQEGRVEVAVKISKKYELVTNYSLEVYLDGEHQWTYGLQEMEENQRSLDTSVILDVPPGRHDVEFILRGVMAGEGGWIQLENWTIPFVRLSNSSSDPSLGRLLGEEDGVLLLDGLVEAFVGDVVFLDEEFEYFDRMHVIMWEGSRIVIDNLDVQNVLDLALEFEGPGKVEILNATVGGYLSFYDLVESPSDFRLTNADIYSFYQTVNSQSVSWENVTILTGNFVAYDSQVEICDVDSDWGLFIELLSCSTCDLMDSDFGLLTRISLYNSELNMTNVSISQRDDFWYETRISISYGSWVNISRCSFTDVMLVLNVDTNEEWYINITDCSFHGEDAILWVMWASDDNSWILQNDVGTITNNTFSGHDSGLICQFTMLSEMVGENVFLASSRLVAMYTPNVWLVHNPYSQEKVLPDLIFTDSPFQDEPPMEADGDWRHCIFLDVTEDPSGYNLEQGIWARVYQVVGNGMYVEDFVLIYPIVLENEVQSQPWADIEEAILLLLADKAPDNWWED